MREISNLQQLKRRLEFCDPQKMAKHTGLSTGCGDLDAYLAWGGLPKGEVSLFRSDLGLGATSLWLKTAASLLKDGRWVAWVGSAHSLFPLALVQKQIPLQRLLIVQPPPDEKKLCWSLQELLSADLFDLIGCDIQGLSLKAHQVRKLARQAQISRASLVFFTVSPCYWSELCSLILHFHCGGITIERARHRPTPFSILRRWSYAHLMSEYKKNLQRGSIRYFSQVQPTSSIS